MEASGTRPKEISDSELSEYLQSTQDYFSIAFMARTPVLEEIISSGNLVNISNSDLRQYLMLWEQITDPLYGTQDEYKKYRDEFLGLVIEVGSINKYGGGILNNPKIDGLDFPNNNKLILQSRRASNLLWMMRTELYLFQEVIYPSVKNHIETIIKLIDEQLS